ncbi:MAG: hypothetical protein OEZ06_21380 [Myxococcales bacterium]|nr:hypothetical protein [Myxococcales bacterium]
MSGGSRALSEALELRIGRSLAATLLRIPECQAAAWVDLDSATLLSARYRGEFRKDLERIAAAASDLLDPRHTTALPDVFGEWDAGQDEGTDGELVVISGSTVNLFMRSRSRADRALIVRADGVRYLGALMSSVRQTLAEAEETIAIS